MSRRVIERDTGQMVTLDDYADRYDCLEMSRDDEGILLVRFHTSGGPFQWGLEPHEELGRAFADIGADRENRLVIVTGSGDVFSGPPISPASVHFEKSEPPSASQWDVYLQEARRMIMNLLDIDVPVISALNGPVYRHAELVLMNDIVICADDTTFEDRAHLQGGGLVPGDGVHVLWPMLLGANRARYFMLTGQQLSTEEAHNLGLVAEVLPRDEVLDRAYELARMLLTQSTLALRYSRLLFVQPFKERMLESLSFGMALEGLAATDRA